MNALAQRLKNMQRLGLLGPQAGRSPSVVSYDPVAQVSQAQRTQQARELARPQGDPYDGLRAWAATRPQQGSGDGGGVLGTILNNPLGKAVGAGLSAVDVPRRAVISGLREGIDAFGSGDASLSDFFSQVGDESFGFGSVVGNATGNKWLDRGLGFLGDVALDPLTYLTFGAGKFAGQAGRVAATTRLAEAGGDAAALQRVGRLGILGARGGERAAIFDGIKGAESLAEPGLRFAGKRIPGTAGVAQSTGEGLARLRARIGDAMPRSVRDTRVPLGLEDQFQTLRSGSGDTRSAIQAITGTNTMRGTAQRFDARFANDADRLARVIKKEDSTEVFRMLDGEVPLRGPLATKVRGFFDEVFGEASKTAKGLKYRENFVPHQWTREAREALSTAPVRIDGVSVDLTEATGSGLQRKIGPGSKVELPDGSIVNIETGFASEINQKLAPLLGVSKVIEDDLTRVLKPFVNSMGETVGRAQMLKRIERIGTPGAQLVDEIDERATDALRARRLNAAGQTQRRGGRDRAFLERQLDQAALKVRKEAVEAAESRTGAAKEALRALGLDDAQAGRAERGLRNLRTKVPGQFDQDVAAAERRLADLGTERSASLADEVAEREAIAQGRRSGKLTRDRERIAAKRAGKTPPSGPIPETEAAREAERLLNERVARRATEFDTRYDSIKGSISEAERRAAREVESIDAARRVTRERVIGNVQRRADAEAELENAKDLLKRAKKAKPLKSKRTPNAYDSLGSELEDVARQVGTYGGSETTRDLLSYYATGVAKLTRTDESVATAQRLQKALESGEMTPVLRQVVKDGFERIGESILGEADAPIVKSELARMLKNFDKATQPDSAAGLWKVVDSYTKFFKTYATATPGFHSRNGMSAAFMNASDGVSVRNMQRGVDLWSRFSKNPKGYLDNLPNGVTREQAEKALEAVFESGGGGGQFGQAELRLGRSKLTNNPVTRLSQWAGSQVEGWVRTGMALDSILAGESVEQAAARITRIHFDYSQVSRLDKSAKRLIPFWTFMSRNVPLQLQQMFLKPRMYQAYKSLVRNMGEDYEADLVPKYWQDAGAFKLTDGIYAAPDLPFTRLTDDLNKLTKDPQALFADANPILKVPLETLVAKRQFFQDRPFEENGMEAVDDELALFGPILKLLGATKQSGSGETVIDERLAYAIRNMLPPVSQGARLVSPDPYYEDRRAQSVAGYTGVPLKFLTDKQQQSEQRRRNYEEYERRAREKALAEFSSER